MDASFLAEMKTGYALTEPGIVIGGPMLDGVVATDASGVPYVQVALSMLNRHGLVAGATGTGKTKTLQVLAGQISDAGIPCFVADIKGDVTGMAAAGDATNEKILARSRMLGLEFTPSAHPVELLSLTGKLGVPVRASVRSFGPLLLSKVLDLNQTQTAVLTLVFKYCDDKGHPLDDLADLRATVAFLASDEGKDELAEYGGLAPATAAVILRGIVTLEQEGAGDFFGMPEFEVADLMRTATDGRGIVSLLELSDVMERPRLFSTFMLWLLARLYATLPEAGDLPKPKLCFFFDEAHLLFADASDALLELIERTARLIRSKGVGVFFVTQAPTDVPSSVLAQLGNRVQHALRAFTPQDADDLAKVVKTFPASDFYKDLPRTITSLGIGEALVTVLSPRGVPTPLAATLIVPPDSMMAALPTDRAAAIIAASPLATKYGTRNDRDSAEERIARQAEQEKAAAAAAAAAPKPPTQAQIERDAARQRRDAERDAAAEERRRSAEVRAAEREEEAARKRREREAAAERRAAERQQQELIRAGTRVLTSRTFIKTVGSVIGSILGGSRRR